MTGWLNESCQMPFTVVMIWRELKYHLTDYFCLANTLGITEKSKHMVQYLNLLSAIRPALQSDNLLAPRPPETGSVDDENEGDVRRDETQHGLLMENQYDLDPLF
jgi:hypothetical protein